MCHDVAGGSWQVVGSRAHSRAGMRLKDEALAVWSKMLKFEKGSVECVCERVKLTCIQVWCEV